MLLIDPAACGWLGGGQQVQPNVRLTHKLVPARICRRRCRGRRAGWAPSRLRFPMLKRWGAVEWVHFSGPISVDWAKEEGLNELARKIVQAFVPPQLPPQC